MTLDFSSRPALAAPDAINPEPTSGSAGWIQPSVVTITRGGRHLPLTGQLINDLYLVPKTFDNDDDGEMDGIVAAYDEAKAQPSDPIVADKVLDELKRHNGER